LCRLLAGWIQWNSLGSFPKPAVACCDQPDSSSDAGWMLLRALDERLALRGVMAGALAGLPRPTFSRCFRRATGYPPTNFQQHVRVEATNRRLERSDKKVSDASRRR